MDVNEVDPDKLTLPPLFAVASNDVIPFISLIANPLAAVLSGIIDAVRYKYNQ
jgi:hypothetical protein